jgi:hypothetical protein
LVPPPVDFGLMTFARARAAEQLAELGFVGGI